MKSNQKYTTRFAESLLVIVGMLLNANDCTAQSSSLPVEAIDSTTVAVVRIDTKLLSDQLPSADWSKIVQGFATKLDEFCKLAEGKPLYVTCSIPYGERSPVVQLLAPESLVKGKFSEHPFLSNMTSRAIGGDWVAFTSKDAQVAMRSVSASSAVSSKLLEHNFDQGAIRLVMQPPAYVRTLIQELLPILPASLGGGSSRALTDGILSLEGNLDLQQSEINLVVQSANSESASGIAAIMPKLLERVVGWRSSSTGSIGLEQLSVNAPQVVEDRVTWKLKFNRDTVSLVAGPLSSEQRSNQFKQIMLAIHNFESAYKYLPPLKASRNEDGSSKLSWRVHLLPFIGESELYQQFHLDESWDSPHNRPLVERIPDIYRASNLQEFEGVVPKGYTTVLAPADDDSVLGSKKVATFSKITDGTSNTICLVDVKPEKAVPWTSPQDYVVDSQQPLSGLQIDSDGRAIVAFGDGSVYRIKSDMPAEKYLNLFRMSDGNVVDRGD